MTSENLGGDPIPPAAGQADPQDAGDGQEARAAPPRKRRAAWRDLPVLLLIALVIALTVKSYVVQPFYIPSASMQDTLEKNDKVLVNKLVYHFRDIEPGDIVVFNGAGSWNQAPPPARPGRGLLTRFYDATIGPLLRSVRGLFDATPGQSDYVKRVIGVPGDHVACCTAQGLLTVNGTALHETSYLYPGDRPGDAPETAAGHFQITVPPGRLWVMGDHRQVSEDSRLRRDDPGGGTILESAVVGRAFLIVWPPSRWRNLPVPATFTQPGIRPGTAALGTAAPGPQSGPQSRPQSGPVAMAVTYLPAGAGLAGAIPLTSLRRRQRERRRLRGTS